MSHHKFQKIYTPTFFEDVCVVLILHILLHSYGKDSKNVASRSSEKNAVKEAPKLTYKFHITLVQLKRPKDEAK